MHGIDDPLPSHRDLVGYGATPPHAHWPNQARVAVSLVLNLEEGSERAFTHGDDRNESIYDMIETIDNAPNLTMKSAFRLRRARRLLADRAYSRKIRRDMHG